MNAIKNYGKQAYEHPLIRYVFVGGSTFIMDLAILVFLKENAGWSLALSTTVAYWIAVTYNFCLNRFWTFSVAERQDLRKHLVNYLLLLAFNYIFTLLFISVTSHFIYFGFAKAIAVIIQTSWTYYIYKNYIFLKTSN